jgi:hypothetical protein
MGVLDTIQQATKARRSVKLILDAALDDEWLSLQSQLVDAADKDADAGSLARPATTALVNRMEKIRAQVEASEVTFVFEQVPWAERIALQVEHPAREGNTLDRLSGYNVETFTPAIIRRACIGAFGDGETEPTPLDDKVWDDLFAKLNYGQVDRLLTVAIATNDGVARVPSSARSLLGTQDSGASLAQPGPGTSARNASKAGSRRTSRKSSATPKVESAAS